MLIFRPPRHSSALFRFRRGALVCVVATMTLVLTGCGSITTTPSATAEVTPTYHPAPADPGPTSASDADAAAAIAAYLAYVEAGNAVDLTDPATVESALSFTTGTQREFEADFYADLAERGWQIAGRSSVLHITPSAVQPPEQPGTVVLDVCVNNEEAVFLDAAGERRVPPGMQAQQAVRATMTRTAEERSTPASPEWLVANTSPNKTDESCGGGGA